jgi:hypothetical protein
MSVYDFLAVNRAHREEFEAERGCSPPLACAPCPPPAAGSSVAGYFGATCEAERCVVFDARAAGLTVCMVDEECTLRFGVDCCEACSASEDRLIGIRRGADLGPLACGTAPVACPGCAPIYPPNYVSSCVSSQCRVRYQP